MTARKLLTYLTFLQYHAALLSVGLVVAKQQSGKRESHLPVCSHIVTPRNLALTPRRPGRE